MFLVFIENLSYLFLDVHQTRTALGPRKGQGEEAIRGIGIRSWRFFRLLQGMQAVLSRIFRI